MDYSLLFLPKLATLLGVQLLEVFLDILRRSTLPMDKSTIFISYARPDAEFALKLGRDLRSAGANIWLDQLEIVAGERWEDAIEEAINASETILVILSPTSVESDYVKDELSFAREEKKEIIPVLYQSCKVPFRMRRIQHCDFTTDYNSGLTQLLKALDIELLSEAPEPLESINGVAKQSVIQGLFEDKISKQINAIINALPPPTQWILRLNQAVDEERLKILYSIRSVIIGLTEGGKVSGVDDLGLAPVIGEIARRYLADSDTPEIRWVVFQIRSSAYGLPKDHFQSTNVLLTKSAIDLLNSDIFRQQVNAFVEITKHANSFPMTTLSEIGPSLSRVRSTRDFKSVLDGEEIRVSEAFASVEYDAPLMGRVWKRVWPTVKDGGWGSVECTLFNQMIHKGDIEDVSLCGVYCTLPTYFADGPFDEIAEARLILPGVRKPIQVKSSRFKRGWPAMHGYAIDFLDMEPNHMERLVIFVRSSSELDSKRRPSNAPTRPPEI
jgi:hypothetical protein